MADEETTTNGSATGVADPPQVDEISLPPTQDRGKKGKKDDDLEYEVEFATPFGKLEFEFEPTSKKEKKDRERKAKAERDAARKKAVELAKRAERESTSGGGGGRLLPTLLVIGIIVAAVIAAYWLFARPEEDLDAVPPEFANEPQPAPQGFVGRAQSRIRDAVRAGRSASREAQREQREKFERMTGAPRSD
jgi:hypothetical protein